MGERDAFAFHHVNAHGGRVEQNIHDVIIEQIHLVDIEQSSIGVG